jgi:hypothetical protein
MREVEAAIAGRRRELLGIGEGSGLGEAICVIKRHQND